VIGGNVLCDTSSLLGLAINVLVGASDVPEQGRVSLATDCPTRRSARGCSSAAARSNITCGRFFAKLEITSRAELQRALPSESTTA
jgi:hypothetical protein